MPWLVSILCLLGLVVLFFPFVFRIEFSAKNGKVEARFFFFKKLLGDCSKTWGKTSESKDDGEFDDDKSEPVMPEFVPAKSSKVSTPEAGLPKQESLKTEERKVPEDVTVSSTADSCKIEAMPSPKPVEAPRKYENTEKKSVVVAENNVEEEKKTEVKPEKKNFTEQEFWTLLLTPDFDARAWSSVKSLLCGIARLFRLKFIDCFVEGIRMNYLHMGYGAALNGILKSFPFVGDWDFRMDWTYDHELQAAGEVRGTLNLCRFIGLVLLILIHGSIVGLSFYFRRRHVLKTGELPELGYIRKKIVKFMVE